MLLLTACNVDNVITIGQKPEITAEQNRFQLKSGQSITLSPKILHADGATTYAWTMQGVLLGQVSTYTFKAEQEGAFLLTLTVTNSEGSSSANFRIEVSRLAPPRITFAVGEDRLFQMVVGRKYTLLPDVQSDSQVALEWTLDGQPMGGQSSLDVKFDQTGEHTLKLKAENEDGESECELMLCVSSHVGDMFYIEQMRHVALGRTIYLEPTLWDVEREQVQFEWSAEGKLLGTEPLLCYTPEEQGKQTILLKVSANGHSEQREITVECHPAESESKRVRSAESQRACNKVFAYTPAAGQFINENNSGFRGENTPSAAAQYAQKRLEQGQYVSLGAWGGELIVGFDHSVEQSFRIGGNFYEGSSEAGIVWVAQDTNRNGEPDDEWYEMRGSEWGGENHRRLHAITYYAPQDAEQNIAWRDNKGQMGYVYRNGSHTQESYYPAWVGQQNYTLYGSWLRPATIQESSSGKYINQAYGWGYADNDGEDGIQNSADSEGAYTVFELKNAVNIDGTAAELQYIDFVRVQSAICHSAGELGEISTEVTEVSDNF